MEFPKYWKHKKKISGGFQRYAETGGKVAMLQVNNVAETDDDYPVTLDGLMDDNDNMIDVMERTFFEEVTDYEVVDTGTVEGILYKGTMDVDDTTGTGLCFVFPSEKDRNWCYIMCCQSDNTKYLYDDDFMKIINSIK